MTENLSVDNYCSSYSFIGLCKKIDYELDIVRSQFWGWLIMWEANFGGELILWEANFGGGLILWEANFGGGLILWGSLWVLILWKVHLGRFDVVTVCLGEGWLLEGSILEKVDIVRGSLYISVMSLNLTTSKCLAAFLRIERQASPYVIVIEHFPCSWRKCSSNFFGLSSGLDSTRIMKDCFSS